MKYIVTLPSSAAVEGLLSIARMVANAKRNRHYLNPSSSACEQNRMLVRTIHRRNNFRLGLPSGVDHGLAQKIYVNFLNS